MPAMSLSLGLPYGGRKKVFVGPLDGFESDLTLAWDLKYRLLSSYTGPAFLCRADRTGQPTMDIPYTPQGVWDETALAAFVGTDDFYVIPYNQSGSGLVITQSFASLQFKLGTAGALDPNGAILAYPQTSRVEIALGSSADLIGSSQGQFYSRMLASSANPPQYRIFLAGSAGVPIAYVPVIGDSIYFYWTGPDQVRCPIPDGMLGVSSSVSLEKDATVARIRVNGSVLTSGPATGTVSFGAHTWEAPYQNGTCYHDGNLRSYIVWKSCDSTTAAARCAALEGLT